MFIWPRCPYCQSTNVVAGGEYVCRDCGTVIGPVLVPPRQPPPTPLRHAAARYRLIMALEREDKKSAKRRYSEIVKMHLDKIAEALGAEVAAVALEMFRGLDRRVYQGKSPRVIAATLAYIAAERPIHPQAGSSRNLKRVQILHQRHGVASQAASAKPFAVESAADMSGYIYICDEFIETELSFDDVRRRERVTGEVKRAFRECVGVEAESAELARGVMAKDWAVLEYEVRAKIGALRARVVFTDGSPAKALEEAERVAWRGGGP